MKRKEWVFLPSVVGSDMEDTLNTLADQGYELDWEAIEDPESGDVIPGQGGMFRVWGRRRGCCCDLRP